MSWKVADVMTREIVSVPPETPFKECVEMIGVHRVGALPVLDYGGRLLGILTESDLLRKQGVKGGWVDARGAARVAADLMSRAVICVGPGTAIAEAARLMHETSVRHLAVTLPDGRLAGIVARADLLKVFLRSDESIRREIAEDLLPATFGIEPGTLRVDVREGVVHLAGEVESLKLARLVEAFAERVEGVVGVTSHLHPGPKVPGAPGPSARVTAGSR
jgi:CBS domain-containing protein